MTYRYALLDPSGTPAAEERNNAIFGVGPVYGVEITRPDLAERAASNLDPQHLGGDPSTAAIEAALHWSPPPDGATLATIRVDMDSVGAMAVLTCRASGHLFEPPLVDLPGEENDTARVLRVARADCEAAGPWPGIRRLADPRHLIGPLAGVDGMATDASRTLEERVFLVARWILAGSDAMPRLLATYQTAAIREAERALANLHVEMGADGVAWVRGEHRFAFQLGYRMSPVVVAENPAHRLSGGRPHLKYTIARWNSSIPMDWSGMRRELDQREPGWGGSSSIVGSPQGRASTLTSGQVLDIVGRHRTTS